ncbi:MAG: phosphoribosylformylglycinamidine synthase [Clostridiales Family XIII bacterium]|jgi:phosphoribosylformylglycinamidine synthase|nr:phosphoribosylformylglycinamidine synthase [Clostridiales Family XIII bacterium]
MVRRVYVEKKPGFDVEAQNLKKELKENLGIAGLKRVRVINRYDVENIGDELYEKAKQLVFSEPNLDRATDEEFGAPEESFSFGIEYLPGQFDQRADSAATCIRLIDPDADPIVRCAKIIVIESALGEDVKAKILKYCINPVDSRRASSLKPATLAMALPEPPPVKVVEGFRRMDDGALRALSAEMGFAMNFEDLAYVREYFISQEFRDPTVTELRVIDTYWSDHCRHTTFLTNLTGIEFEGGGLADVVKEAYENYLKTREEVYGAEAATRPVTLMDMATIGAKALRKRGLLEDLDESDEINACSIKVKADVGGKKENWLVMFKNETHNHPTEIEPFGGAATCLGGAIRDPLSGRAYVYQAMRVTGSGDPGTAVKDTLPGKLTQYQITRGAAKGYSSYGNQIGIATGLVDEIYDESYVAKRLEIGAVIGAAPAGNVRRMEPAKGDVILVVGGRTGRDGIGGATGSSKEHTEESIYTAGAEVQKGNPPIERDIQRLFRRPEAAKLIKRCNDFGAGGVSVAIGELSPSIDVDLDKVPKKYEGLDGTELAISESQERMAVVIAKEDVAAFSAYAEEENVEVCQVAKVTDTGRFRMYWRDDLILDLSRKFLDTNGVAQQRKALVRDQDIRIGQIEHRKPGGIGRVSEGDEELLPEVRELYSLLSDLNCAGKRGLIEYFDSTIGAGSVLMPLGGKHQLTQASGMAAKLPVLTGDTNTATLMSYGFDPRVSKESPFHGAMYAVLESLTRIAAMGGDIKGARLSFQEYFPKLGRVPTRWASPVMALLGGLTAQLALGVPAIGGKDSMSGSFRHLDVAPTLVSFAVAVADARHVLSPEFKQAGSKIVLLECKRDASFVPDFAAFKKNAARIHDLAKKGKLLSASHVGAGGLFVSIARMAFGNRIGAVLFAPMKRLLLFENYGSLLVEVGQDQDAAALFKGLGYQVIGETVDSQGIELRTREGSLASDTSRSIVLPLSEIEERWETPLVSTFPVQADAGAAEGGDIPMPSFSKKGSIGATVKIGAAKPRVLIPVFPGTNCEVDSRRAFERAGAEVCVVGLLTQNHGSLAESIARMAEEIGRSQIVMIPGGFSGGDEPEGSAKFISAVFRSPQMREAVSALLEQRDGLMLGVCNGFQALVKLGLIPYGRITEPDENAPTLTYNTIGRHMSKLVRSRVGSALSPWLAHAEVGAVHTMPVSHGEGRFFANEETLAMLFKNGQVATQYVDMDDRPTYDIRYNPNGSIGAIEGVTSPDGRIFGRMGHPERNAPGLYVNVPGDFDYGVFASGVRYFK